MSAVVVKNIEELFDLNRCNKPWDIFPLFFYFPLGLVLSVVRFFIGCHAFLVACLLPKLSAARWSVPRFFTNRVTTLSLSICSAILRTMCTVLGIVVVEHDSIHRDQKVKIIVTNHISTLDHLAVDLVKPCILPGVWDLPNFLNWCLGFKDLGVKEGRDVLIQNVKKHMSESRTPILSHPEGATTNSRAGLLKFSTWPFSLEQPVQPVLISATRPLFTNVSLSVLGSRWWSDLFWFMFVPYTFFTIRYLPVMKKEASETTEEFCQRVQTVMAQKLGIVATVYSCADKVEYAKRVLRVATRSTPAPRGHNTSELSRMAIQVKDVLPHVPLGVIRDDLVITRCVDVTVSRLLEGVVSFVPETIASRVPLASRYAFPANGIVSTDKGTQPANKGFGKTATERMQSYQERKSVLLDNARRRYAQRHGMEST